MRLTTWNVNGIRNPFSYQPWNTARTFPAMFDILGSDIVVMQELKIQRKDLRDDMVLLDDWDCFFSLPKHKKGYSGVGIYTRNATCAPIRAEEGLLGVLPSASGVAFRDLPEDESIGGYPSERQVMEIGVDPAMLDAEGRCVVLEFPAFVLFGVYSPANSNGQRDDFRFGFILALDYRIRNLIRAGKNVVLVGDLNVSRSELDTANAVEDLRKEGMTHEDYISTPNRRIFNHLLINGEVVGERDEGRETGVLWDTTREFHPERKGMYTHWEQKINARPGNFGSRIDFVLVCGAMQSWIKDANIQEGLLGSDHCPVYADFHDRVSRNGDEVDLLDVMNPNGTFASGKRMREWKISSSPAFSAKHMPEFAQRRSIKSMFAAPAAKKAQASPEKTATKASTQSSMPSSQSQTRSPNTSFTSPSPVRRKSSATGKDLTLKRSKPGVSAATKGQQSLKGFFQAKPTSNTDVEKRGEASCGKDSQVREIAPRDSAMEDDEEEIDSDRSTKRRRVETDHEQSNDNQRLSVESRTKRSSEQEDRNDSLIGSTSDATASNNDTASQSIDRPSTPPPRSTAPSAHATLDACSVQESPGSAISANPSPVTSSKISPHINLHKRLNAAARWSALLTPQSAPKCESHGEPCKTMLTKKKGENQGRSFWMCARPLGPSGQKEKNTEWRCPTFIWATDWKGGGGNGG